MSSPILAVEHLCRKFRRQSIDRPSIKTRLLETLQAPRRKDQDFWALSDVSFSVERGEVVGITGPNGSGKTTLMRIISRILPATYGRILLRGTVSGVLSLAAGFHPEMTGRENLELSWILRGGDSSEFRRRRLGMEEFAGLGDFIYAPVRTYSAGMILRLGFSVIAHSDADLVLLDEILMVGDESYQKRCFQWLMDCSKHGRTILLVSHDTQIIRCLCTRVLKLKAGKLVLDGVPTEVFPNPEQNDSPPQSAEVVS